MASDLTPISLEEELEALRKPLYEQVEKGKERLAALEQAVKEQKQGINRARRALQIVDPTFEPPQKATPKVRRSGGHVGIKRANGIATGFGISAERAGEFADKILELTDKGKEGKFVGQRQVYGALGSDQGQASSAFRFLRSIQFLRKAGKNDSGGDQWAVLDKDALKKWIQETEGETNG